MFAISYVRRYKFSTVITLEYRGSFLRSVHLSCVIKTMPYFFPELLEIFNIHFTQTIDSTERNKILDSLTQKKLPSKLIRFSLVNATAKVQLNNAYTAEFRMESGVKRGDPLFPTLFSLMIDTLFF